MEVIVICNWFGFNAIIVTHLLKLSFEFAHTPIVKDNKLRLRVTCQPGDINNSGMNVADLLVASTISNQPVAGSIIVSASKAQRVCFGWCPYCKWIHQIHTNHEPWIQC
jgi:hypothetical protein